MTSHFLNYTSREVYEKLLEGIAVEDLLLKTFQHSFRNLTDQSESARVLQQYADFLDLVARIEEAESVRDELSEIMEEVQVDDFTEDRSQFSDTQINMDKASHVGSFGAALRRKSTAPTLDLPPVIFRPAKERKALRAFKRVVSDIQDFYRKKTSIMIAFLCLVLFAIATATMGSIEYLLR
ncbi:hypothetical protein HDU67_005033 [Dinochytrium kinnereticum]|nr:hypothetical protein HDU67_005033 [Dinochytrium kinnereticum]